MEPETHVLPTIRSPEDLKKLSPVLLDVLADEIREFIIGAVSRSGGHLASNLGVVELTIALHRVFDSPRDKIIWDVGHQCYTHKILTGRAEAFDGLRRKGGISGFPKRTESVHDIVDTGHSSTSISAGLGIIVGQQLLKTPGKVIAVIGDGALMNGMAFEGLNNTGHLGRDMIVVLNDNKMSIGPNVGALSSYLSRLTASPYYQRIRTTIDNAVEQIPYYGDQIMDMIVRLKKGVKAVFFKDNIFSELGYEYVGPIDGHNIELLTRVFEAVRGLRRPVVVHVMTRKGKGYLHAEGDPSLYHGVTPFSAVDGKIEKKGSFTFTECFSDLILDACEKDEKVVAISAAMCDSTGLSPVRNRYPERVFDVGITEQHAITFAAGLAVSGLRPVVAVYSTFMQRAVDQVIHDVALTGLPVVIAMDRAGLVGGDGETHQGIYDIPLFRAVPGITFLSPSSAAEMRLLFDHALTVGGPVLIRYPKDDCGPDVPELCAPVEQGKGVFVHEAGEQVLLVSMGGTYREVAAAGAMLSRRGIETDLYNLRFLKPVDEEYLISVLSRYRFVFLFEDGAVSGGIGEYIGSLVSRHRLESRYVNRGVPDEFLTQATRTELLVHCGLDSASIVGQVEAVLSEQGFSKESGESEGERIVRFDAG